MKNEEKRVRVLYVKQVPETESMSPYAKKLLRVLHEDMREYGYLKLYVFPHYINESLDRILEEGMYEYVTKFQVVKEMLEQLNDYGHPVMFDADDIFEDVTFTPTFTANL